MPHDWFIDQRSRRGSRIPNAAAESPQAALNEVQQRIQWKLDRVLRRWDAVGNERVKEWTEYDPG